jgi:hypothetical protein
MSARVRVERALTLADPAVGWVVISNGFGAYFRTWAEAMTFAWSVVRRQHVDTGVACRHELHELCHTDWCICGCHDDGSDE